MKKGKIIFLNGVTSSGKTTISEKIQEIADELYYHVSNDIFHCMIGRKFWIENSRRCIIDSIITMYYAVKAMCENGINVIIDGMLLDMRECVQEYGQHHYHIMKSILADMDIFMVEVFCPLDECRHRNIMRGDRGEYQSENQNQEMHKDINYDFTVDTSVNTARDCAAKILNAFSLR